MNKNQKGFIAPLIAIIVAVLVIGGGVSYYLKTKSETPVVVNNEIVASTTEKKITTTTVTKTSVPEFDSSSSIGTKSSLSESLIVSIDPVKKSFVINMDTTQTLISLEISTSPSTVIRKGNSYIKFGDLSLNDLVWVRALKNGPNKYSAQQIIVISSNGSEYHRAGGEVIINNIDLVQNKITAEVFLGNPKDKGKNIVLTIIPETEIRKGTAEEGSNRKVVRLNDLAIGDIASIFAFAISSEIYPQDVSYPYAVDIDVVSPYYCQQYLKPPGCIEKK